MIPRTIITVFVGESVAPRAVKHEIYTVAAAAVHSSRLSIFSFAYLHDRSAFPTSRDPSSPIIVPGERRNHSATGDGGLCHVSPPSCVSPRDQRSLRDFFAADTRTRVGSEQPRIPGRCLVLQVVHGLMDSSLPKVLLLRFGMYFATSGA